MSDVDLTIRDVTMRDGLQDADPISTSAKMALFVALSATGVREVELTSFVRPDRVPSLADAEQLAQQTAGSGLVRWALVLNTHGAERALAAGLRHLQFVLSVSQAHNLGNAGRTVDQSLVELERIVELAVERDAVVEVTAATAFGCPHEGPVAPDDVMAVIDRAVEAGCIGVGLADTIGVAVPTEVAALVRRVTAAHPDVALGVHLHDTRGLAIANCLAGLDAGATRVDGSVAGLGGCPFATGATGNLSLEDLVHALDHMGVNTGIDLDALLHASGVASALTGSTPTSRVVAAGPRFAWLDSQ